MEIFSRVRYKNAFWASSSLLNVTYQQSEWSDSRTRSHPIGETGQWLLLRNKSKISFSVASNGTLRKIIIQRFRVGR
jgi:hypothetical protein